jgi:hypothetical protein
VVWEVGGGDSSSYPILNSHFQLLRTRHKMLG